MSLLETYEVVCRLKMGAYIGSSAQNTEQVFFVPGLLPSLTAKTTHVALDHWKQMVPKYEKNY